MEIFKRTLVKESTLSLVEQRVWGRGFPGETAIAIVGEAPGKEESEQLEPFVGKAGKFLQKGLIESRIYKPWITNVLTLRPPNNDINHKIALEALNCELMGFWEEIEFLVKHKKVKVIVALGTTAMKAFGIQGNISSNRGYFYEVSLKTKKPVLSYKQPYDFLVMPTYHPAFLLRGSNRFSGKTANGRIDNLVIWLNDLVRAREQSEQNWNRLEEHFILKPTIVQLEQTINKIIKNQILVGCDIETTGLNPEYGKIVVIGLATSPTEAISIPLLEKRNNQIVDYWSETDKKVVFSLLKELFSRSRMIFQNGLFDITYLRRKGFNIDPFVYQHDTMIMHHTLNPELPHNIGFITSVYGKTPYWKEDFLNRSVHILDMDPTEMRTYNLRDCVVLLQSFPNLQRELVEKDLWNFYLEEPIQLARVIIDIMLTGVELDKKAQKAWKHDLSEQLEQIDKKLIELGNLPEGFSLNKKSDLLLFLLGQKNAKFTKLEEALKNFNQRLDTLDKSLLTATEKQKQKLLSTKERLLSQKNYLETLDQINVIRNTKPLYIGQGLKLRTTTSGELQLDKQNRLNVINTLTNRLSSFEKKKSLSDNDKKELEQIPKLLDWLYLYEERSTVYKLLTTYTNLKPDSDGKIRSKLSVTGTATGRLSSKDPNLQNIPKKNKAARKMLKATNPAVCVSFDYTNLEVITLAYEANDPKLIEAVLSGNLHDTNTKLLFGIDETNEKWSSLRRTAKTFFFGRIAYGGSDREIYSKIIAEEPSCGLTYNDFIKAVQRYFDNYPVLSKYQAKVRNLVQTERKIKNSFGRIRTFYDAAKSIEKEALNFPNQSDAASIINRATIRVWKALRQSTIRAKLQMQIHDQLIFECHSEDTKKLISLVKPLMEQEVTINSHKVKVPVEVEIGKSWGELEPINKGV